MRLHTLTRKIVKRSGVLDLTVVQSAREVGDAVGDGVPGTMSLVIWAVGGRVDGDAALDERVEVDHIEVVLEEGDGLGAADGGGEGGDGGE
jgi:hypothetical protein